MLGAEVSIAISLRCVTCGLVIDSLQGIISGYFGGWLDNVIMRLVDFQLSVPFILIAIMALAVFVTGFWSLAAALMLAI